VYSARTDKLLERLSAEGLDALLVSYIPNIAYLSGFSGSTAMLLLTPAQCWMLTDFRYHTQVEQEVDKRYKLWDNTGKDLLKDVLPGIDAAGALRRVGFEGDIVSGTLAAKFAAYERGNFSPTTQWVETLRMTKDDGEIEKIRAAVLLNEKVFSEVLGCIGPDATEADLAAEIYYRGVKHGASCVSFDPIVASGPNSAKPHARFSRSKLAPGAPLTFDMGMKLDGYCSDMTRTVFYKDCPPKWERVYGIVKAAMDGAFAAARPGLKGKEVDAVAREIITQAGHGDHFGHGLGHGVGIEVHEAPRLARVGEQELGAGMVCTNEPGIYLPGEGGIRIEDMFVVTQTGAAKLNTLPTGIQVVA
jgi:Xaa-Pro aminopeptidase